MTLALLAVLVTGAVAAEPTQLEWAVTLDGKPVGKRTLTIKSMEGPSGDTRRVLESFTDIDATVLGLQYRFRERFTANVVTDPAAFYSVVELNDMGLEVQARRAATTWKVTVNSDGREYTRDVAASAIDLSTVDLLDPESRVPISRFDAPKILSAETGDIWSGPIERLGPSEVEIDGETVPVDGYAWTPPDGRATFWYTPDGYLAKYEVTVMGKTLQGVLTDPPPKRADDAPIVDTTTIEEIPL